MTSLEIQSKLPLHLNHIFDFAQTSWLSVRVASAFAEAVGVGVSLPSGGSLP